MNVCLYRAALRVGVAGVAALYSFAAFALPTVTVTSPTASQVIPAPGSITLRATATPTSGKTITKVEFYRGGTTLIGTVTGATTPHTFSWTGIAAAAYSITAKAYDSTGNKTSTAVAMTVRTPPTVSLTSPAAGQIFTAPASVSLAATAGAASGGTVTNVKFFQGATQIGSTDTSSPYSGTWSAAPAGTYSITAVVLDSKGLTTTSAARSITINAPAPPTVSLTAPADGATFTPGSNITVSATATAGTGSLSHVRFLRNGTQIGSNDTSSPYSVIWTSAPAGTYVLTAIARNSGGVETTSASRTITVSNPHTPPVATITAPTSGSLLSAPATINITATAVPQSGFTISKVEFFNDTTKIGEALSAPYVLSWTNRPTGSYLLKAVATDNASSAGTSASVYVVVDGADSCIGAPPLAAKDSATQLASFQGPSPNFEANLGQVNAAVKFRRNASGYQLFLTPTERVMALHGSGKGGQQVALRMKFLGSNPQPEVAGIDEVAGRSNYLVGRDKTKWRRHVPSFASVRYSDLYPGIDEVYRAEDKALEYDLHVAAHADPSVVRFAIEGAESIEIAPEGDLRLRTPLGIVTHRKPVAYQEIDGERRTVDAAYRRISEREFGFVVAKYDPDHALVIDPVLVYSTLLGGTDDTWATGIALSRCGEAYITGWTWAPDFPTTAGAFDSAGDDDSIMGFVAKLNPAGSALMYSTYVTGTVLDPDAGNGWTMQVSQPAAIALDSTGHAYIAGTTQALDYPVTPGSWYTNLEDVGTGPGFLTKLNSDGSELVYSTYVPASDLTAIAVDAANNAYVTGQGRLWKLNPTGTALAYPSTVVIASLGRTAMGVAADAAGNAYVVGADRVNIGATAGAFQATKPSSTSWSSAFLIKVNPAGTAKTWATWLGTTQTSNAYAVTLDNAGSIYVTGSADGGSIPNHTGAFGFFTQSSVHPNDQFAFVAKVAPDGSHLDYYSRLGGSFCNVSGSCFAGSTTARGIDIDPSTGSAWIAGETSSNRLLLVRPLVSTLSSGISTFAAKFGATGTTLEFSTLLGGATDAGGYANNAGIRVDSVGSVYVAGSNSQTDFPTTAGALQTNTLVAGVRNAFVTKINENRDSTTSLQASPVPGELGQPTVLVATVVGNAPSGVVTFKDGTQDIGTASLASGAAQMTTSSLAAGTHTLSASYAGDTQNAASIAPPITYVVADAAAPPSISISGLVDGQMLETNSGAFYVGGQVTVSANAALGKTLANITIYIDSSLYTTSPNQPTWSSSVSLGTLTIGAHTVRAIAFDNNGNRREALVRFVVNLAGSTAPSAAAITSPANGAVLAGPGTFTITGTAGATATQMSFYANGSLIDTASGPPFSVSWVNPGSGSYSLWAVAKTSAGAGRPAAAVGVTVTGAPPPIVSLTSPVNGAEFWANQPVPLGATATAVSPASIVKVDFFDGDQIIGTKGASPFEVTWSSTAAGNHLISARATDSAGAVAISNSALILLKSAPQPTIFMTSPAYGATLTQPATIALTVDVQPGQGAAITQVEYFDEFSRSLGIATTPPYTGAWTAPTGGYHTVSATVTDSRYQTANTSPRPFFVESVDFTVAAGIDGSSLVNANVLITGTINAPTNSAIRVGTKEGYLTFDGRFFINEVPLQLGTNSLAITLMTQEGLVITKNISITRLPGSQVRISANSYYGMPSQQVTFAIEGTENVLGTIEFDLNSDGVVDYTGAASESYQTFVFSAPGYYRVRAVIRDPDGLEIHRTNLVVYIFNPADQKQLLLNVHGTLLERLLAGRIDQACTVFAEAAADKYKAVFIALGETLPSAIDQLGTPYSAEMSLPTSELVFSQQDESGESFLFFVHFIRGSDGIWRIDSM